MAEYQPTANVWIRDGCGGCFPMRAEEERYFAETGIFPVMYVVVLRRDVYEQRPWLAQSLDKAFEQGLVKEQLPAGDLFAAETREEYVI